MSSRPVRLQIVNELGKKQTLPADKDQFEIYGSGVETVFLGLGPEPEKLPELFPEYTAPLYIECPQFEEQVPDFVNRVPSSYWRVEPDVFTPDFAGQVRVIRYRPNLKAFPSFWGPLTGRLAATGAKPRNALRSVWIPHGEHDLLGTELSRAFEQKGFRTAAPNAESIERSAATELSGLLQGHTPELFISINFKGLDPFGLGFNLLREAGVRVIVWLVDNPFNILPAVKSGYWKEADLMVTDSSFVPTLRQAGAQSVHHLPLAASPELFRETGTLPAHARDVSGKTVFVGRSEFPKKDAFYAGLSIPDDAMAEAEAMLAAGGRADWFWWRKTLGVDALWPDNAVRLPGLGAEETGRRWRSMCLRAVDGVTVFGDGGWQEEGIEDVRPPLDYYAHLPAVYREAEFSLNMTSPLLPAGLTQRHFDVWCAGGFLLTDETPGLDIFPHDLVRPVTFSRPEEIAPKLEELRANPAFRRELRAAWESAILLDHTYESRVTALLKMLKIN
ncbi:glycosyltransferase family protein [Salidesulfovibrio brasiliensis]|uniref:glycosyltransferase family protein n=1 Tax=Salidesulfovibrio brasiliensis TaxID=221711 RepID=UPI000AAB82D3|nr:glycosyltransferase [Salidesulfovibrio brasiliensis]